MKPRRPTDPVRRRLLRAGLLLPAALMFGIGLPLRARPVRAATPACPGESTPAQTRGPFFKPESPRRTSLVEAGIDGERIVLEGLVLSTDCRPVAGAIVDLWHADADGRYDNDGFRLRGHQITDAAGAWRFETIAPGNYPPRTRHYHVEIRASGGPVLTTQLYFPDEPANASDFLFRPDLTMALDRSGPIPHARFDFVIDTG
jgi:protocatechuate 3,4-dioxygenase beta subunit